MSNALSADVFAKWAALHKQLGAAIGPPNQPEKITQTEAQIDAFAKANGIDKTKPVSQTGTTTPPADTGYQKPGGWGASTDVSTWVVAQMKNPPTQFKVVDNAGKNVAANFITQTGAQAFIDKAKATAPGGNTNPPAPPSPAPSGGGDNGVDQFGIKQIHKSKPGGQVVTTHAARYFTRNYASGKPSEPTVEMDITGITFADQEVTAIVTMTGMSHPDTIDWKMRGGQHSSSNPNEGSCYDIEVMTDGSSKMTLEVEHPHPDNHPAHQKPLFSPGDLSKARFGWKGVTLNTPDGKGVLVESYINLTPDDNNGWKKYISVVDTGQLLKGFSPILKLIGNLAKIRIDGIIGKPTFDKVSCREITN